MKKFRVVVTAELELPDDFEIAVDPTDGERCLRQGSNYYMPTLLWMERKHYLDAGVITEFESGPSVGWESAKGETESFLFEASIRKDGACTEDYRIEKI